jgi:hypothetical protein
MMRVGTSMLDIVSCTPVVQLGRVVPEAAADRVRRLLVDGSL